MVKSGFSITSQVSDINLRDDRNSSWKKVKSERRNSKAFVGITRF